MSQLDHKTSVKLMPGEKRVKGSTTGTHRGCGTQMLCPEMISISSAVIARVNGDILIVLNLPFVAFVIVNRGCFTG